MNSIERIKATIQFQKTDRVPVIAQVFGHASTFAGVNLREYISDGAVLARGQLRALEHYQYDAVFALMDVNVESEAVGSRLTYRENEYPVIKSYVAESTELKDLRIPDPRQSGRMPELLKAAGILNNEVGDAVLVVGCVVGPMTLATQLLGMERALYLAIDDPETFEKWLDFSTGVCIRFGTAQLEAGVHLPIVFDPSSTPDVIPPQFYREFVMPHVKRVFHAFKKAGSIANWLHTAGPAASILPYYPQMGVDIANIDYCVDPMRAMDIVPETCIDGNIKSFSFLQETPEAIARESSKLIKIFADRGGFILSSGCEIPMESNPENITAMVMETRQEGN